MAINKKLITFDKKSTFLGANGINNVSSPTDGYYHNIPEWSMVFILETGEIWHNGKYFGRPIKDQIFPATSQLTKGIVFMNNDDYYYRSFNLWGNVFDGSVRDINGELVVQGETYKWTYGDGVIRKGNANLIAFSGLSGVYDVFIPSGNLSVTGGDLKVGNNITLASTGSIKGTHILNTNSYFNLDYSLGKTWNSIKLFNTSGTLISLDSTRPAIINIQAGVYASGTNWQPWITGGDVTELSSWGIGLGGDAFYIGRISKSNTENSLSQYWKFDSEDGITISGTTKYIKVADLAGASEKIFMADGTVKALSDIASESLIGEATTTNYGGFKLTQNKSSVQQTLVSNTTGNGRYAVKMNADGTLFVEFVLANTWLPATNTQGGYVPQLSGSNDAISSSLNDYVLTFTSSDTETITPTWRRLPSNAFDNTWRGIYVDNISKLGTGITTKPINFKAGSGITLTFTAAGDNAYNTLQIDGTTYSTATDSTLGLVKVGTTLDDVTGFTAIHIKDGKIYYKDTTYSFSNLKFQLTSGTDLMTYNSLSAKTILAGTGITFSYLDNVLTISSAIYSTATNSILGLVKVGTTLEDTTGYTKVHIDDSGFIYYHDTTCSFSKLKFQQTSGTDLMTYDSQAARTILAGDNITFTHNNNILTIKATDTTYNAATSSVLGLIKIGTTLDDASGYTKVHIKDGFAYYHDTTYSFSKLKFLLTSGTDLMTYDSLAARTIVAGDNITFTHSNNVLTIKATDTTYSTASNSALGLVKTGAAVTDTTGMTAVHIKDGVIYYKDTNTTYSTASNTNLGLVKTGAAINDATGYTACHIKDGIIYYKDTNTTYSTATSSALGLVKVGNTINDTTGYTAVHINNGKIYYKDTNTTYSTATSSTLGLVKIGDTLADATGYTKVAIKDGIIYYKDTNTTYSTATSSSLGLVKVGDTISNATGYTACKIKDGVIYYKDTNTTYSFSNLLFLQTSGTNLMTYNSQAVRTVLAGSNITFTHSNNVLTIAAKNTTYSTVSKSAAGLCPTLPNETITTKYLRLDGTWLTPPDNNTWKPANTSLEGYAPKLTTGGGTIATQSTEYVLTFKSGTDSIPVWRLLPANAYKNTWTAWNGATASANGTAGYMPAPTSEQRGQFLRGDGSWVSLNNYSLTKATTSALGGIIVSNVLTTAVTLTSSNGTTTNRYYGVQLDKDGKAFVNIPWVWTAFTAASSDAAGTAGYILAPKGALNKFFRGDNTWLTINLNVTSALYVGASNGTGNSAQSTNGNVYLIFVEGSSYSRYKISGSGRASVTSDASGNITINSSGYSNFGAATASAAGSAGLVPAPGANVLGSAGYYLRADGTWLKPPNDNTWKAANASQEGYVPKSTANKILRANADGALYWGDDANTTYTFYNLQFQNSGGTTVDTYKPTTSPTKTLKAGSNITISAASNVITIASTNTWNANAVGVAGYVAAPTKAANANMTWLTDANGNPAWRASNNHSHNYLPLSGGTVTGTIYLRSALTTSNTTNTGAAIGIMPKLGNPAEGDTTSTKAGIGFMYTRPNVNSNDTLKGISISAGSSDNWYEKSGGLFITSSEITWQNNKVWHAGNDGSGSGLDSDKLDSLHSNEFPILSRKGTAFVKNGTCDVTEYGTYYSSDSSISSTLTNTPHTGSNFKLWHLATGLDYYPVQMAVAYNNAVYFRGNNNGTWNAWKKFAFTDSNITGNAGSATKLANKRTLWGQEFDGTDNVSGDISSTGNITPSTTISSTIGSSTLMYEKAYLRRIDTQSGYDLRFNTGGTERMKISASDGTITVASDLNVNIPKINGVTVGSSPKFTDTTYSTFIKSGSTAAAGLVPKPPTTAGTTKYLCEDGTWTVPTDTNTDTKVTSTKTEPASGTTWYTLCTTSSGTATGSAVKSPSVRFLILYGTAETAGYSRLDLGNTTAIGTAGNMTGSILMYGSGGKYAHILPHTGDTTNRTIYTPKSGGTLVVHTTDTAVGSSTQPIYISAAGVATAIGHTIAADVPSGAKFTDTTYSAGTLALYNTGTDTTNRVWSANVLKSIGNKYLPLTGGTMTGNVTFNSGDTTEKCIDFVSNRAGGTGGWAFEQIRVKDKDNNILYQIGVLGSASTLTYSYIGTGNYNSANNLRIYPTYPAWGANKIWHAGNDGADSGLDADLLDGQHGNYYAKENYFYSGGVAKNAKHLPKGYGYDGGEGITNPYHLMAEATVSGTGARNITGVFLVSSFYNHSRGILFVQGRIDGSGTTVNTTNTHARWITKDSDLDVNNFILTTKATSDSLTCKLYYKVTGTWDHARITLLDDSSWASTTNVWVLHSSATNTAGNYVFKTIPSGETQFVSVDVTTSKYASQFSTSRTLWGKSFDGSANISGNMTNVGNITFTNNARIHQPDTSGNILYIGNASNNGWVMLADACSQSGSTYWRLVANGTANFKNVGINMGATDPSYPLHVSGNVGASNFYTTSDRSKKQNISTFSEHIRKFQLKDTEKWHYGVIAQEVEEMFRDGKEGSMTVNYNSVLSYYVGQLENRVKELEDRLKKYEDKVKKC